MLGMMRILSMDDLVLIGIIIIWLTDIFMLAADML